MEQLRYGMYNGEVSRPLAGWLVPAALTVLAVLMATTLVTAPFLSWVIHPW